ncbi:helix-turn-helix transcriptional regulator [Pedobacter sp. MC2016-14]|uniref:response regulator transcription factor n=1 Tax=Pedobacter sp. MC2016-14 TaxID=2897327 RepID=UPI001E5C5D54|nr:helix-turn-helix transcriptional regulator [Pedobacter sp. MC2016-14]MCD0487814.1 helix-turn-helix transcriptional regulator [Pedobacter sp. MC2016-14]
MPEKTTCELRISRHLVCDLLKVTPEQADAFFEKKSVTQYHDLIVNECARVNDALAHMASVSSSNLQMKEHTHTHQQVARLLLDKIECYLESQGEKLPEKRIIRVCRVLIEELGQVYKFIKSTRSKYFDTTLPVPRVYAKRYICQLQQQVLYLAGCMAKQGIEQPLQQLILRDMNAFCSAASCSYEELAYREKLLTSLIAVFGDAAIKRNLLDVGNWNMDLALAMFYMNYNCRGFVEHCWAYIYNDVQEIPDLTEKERCLMQHKNAVEQMDVCSAQEHRPSIKEKLLRKITTELNNLAARRSPTEKQFLSLEINKAVFKRNSGIYALTPREAEIALHIGHRKTDKQIAKQLGVADDTLRTHIRNIYEKLNVHNRVEMIYVLNQDAIVL